MNFQQLEYILAVHEHQHFGKAADSCHITQATLSAMIKKLEEELDATLFDRSRQPVQTTDHGLKVIAYAQKILELRTHMFSLQDQELTSIEGPLKLGVIPTIANSLLPRVLPSLLKENPKLDLTVIEITTDEIKKRLTMDELDLGLLATPLNDQILEETILYYEPMLVYGVDQTKKKYVTSEDIRDNKIWLLEEGHCFRNQAMTICDIREKEQEDTNLHFEGSSFDTLLRMADRFGGVTLVPELFYQELPEREKNRTKMFQSPIPVREVSLVSYRPYAKKQTVAFLAEHIKKCILPQLSTHQYKNSELDIIGI